MEANLDGTGVTTLASNQASPTAVAVNASHIYWTDNTCSGPTPGGTIMESALDGTGAITLVSGLDCPDGVAVDSSHLYWSDGADGTITAAGLDGSSPNVVISGEFNVDAVAAASRTDALPAMWWDPWAKAPFPWPRPSPQPARSNTGRRLGACWARTRRSRAGAQGCLVRGVLVARKGPDAVMPVAVLARRGTAKSRCR